MHNDKVNTETKPKDCCSIVSIVRKKITLLFVAIRDKTPIDAITVGLLIKSSSSCEDQARWVIFHSITALVFARSWVTISKPRLELCVLDSLSNSLAIYQKEEFTINYNTQNHILSAEIAYSYPLAIIKSGI